MPGSEAAYPELETTDRYPKDSAEHARILNWVLDEFNAADRVRQPQADRWKRYYKLYRSFVKRQQGDWRSKVFIPIIFYVIETITPRLVAQLPKQIVTPVGREDEAAAELMEELMDWAAKRSGMYEQLVASYRSALKYGTGILKIYHEHEVRTFTREIEELAPVEPQITRQPAIDPETGQQMTDLDGVLLEDEIEEPVIDPETGMVLEQPTGNMISERQERVLYDGPKAEAIDIFNFWPAPEATSIEGARYVIQRVFRDSAYVQDKIDDGTYRIPPGMSLESLFTGEESEITRLQSETNVQGQDTTREQAEILEVWMDDTVISVLNRVAVVRVSDNPFEHGEKPFVRITDYYQEHEFWGVGEVEPLEGLQWNLNAIVNQRIDNVRLVMDRMFAFDPDNLLDLRDLAIRPGGAIRLKNKELPPNQVIQPIDFPDVTASAYNEAGEIERITEKISGVNAYTAGGGDSGQSELNGTATGASLISEAGNTRFSLKVRMAEITGLTPMARQFASILQQFAEEQFVIRVTGDRGQFAWKDVTAEGIQGAFDFDIEAESSTTTESIRKEQSMTLMQMGSQLFRPDGSQVFNLDKLAEDVLQAFNIKDIEGYLTPVMPPAPPQLLGPDGQPIADPAMQDPSMPPEEMPPEQMPPPDLQAI